MSLLFVYGPMNGGKTVHLLQTVHSWRSRGFQVLIMKPATDTRNEDVSSRIGVAASVDLTLTKTASATKAIEDYLQEQEEREHILIVVDEAQFLTPAQVEELFVYSLTIPVICYGLKTDFSARAFPGSLRLLELAELEEINTMRCRCGEKAAFNARFDRESGRLIASGPTELVEGSIANIIYDPLCQRCFITHGGLPSIPPVSEDD